MTPAPGTDSSSKETRLQQRLAQRQAQRLFRQRRLVTTPQGPQMVVDGRVLLAFCSNDYLGIANDPRVVEALCHSARASGVGGGASHLVCGHHAEHHRLEEALAEFTGRQRAVLFSTGYMANLGVATAFVGSGDHVIEDRLNHASLLDAAPLSRARLWRYQHNDVESLSAQLARAAHGERLVMTDGVFSMDGDVALLPDIAARCRQSDSWLLLDDAHGFGVLGRGGRGTVDHFGLSSTDVPLLLGTLGKAFGTAGAFVAGDESAIEALVQYARTYIYTTAMPPPVAAASRVSLAILRDEQWRRDTLMMRIAEFRQGVSQMGLPLMASETAIQPILVGDAGRSLAISEALERDGFLVTAIRPPTVPPNTARLRFTFSALHTADHVSQLLDALRRLAPMWDPAWEPLV